MDRTVYIVLGCRSGSSLVTGILHYLGVHLGEPLLGPGPDNEKGFFELIPMVDLNSKWTDWTKPLDTRGVNHPLFLQWVQQLMEKHFPHGDFAIKDPRIVALFPWYEKVFKNMGVQVKLIFAQRSYRAVVKSLTRTRVMTLPDACRVAADYEEAMNKIWEKHQFSLTIFYERLLDYPPPVVTAIAAYVNKPWEDQRDVLEFIDSGLDHSKGE